MTTAQKQRAAPEMKNYTYCQETITLKNRIEDSFMDLAARLHKIQALNMYHPSWGSFEEFCMELKNMSYPAVMKLIDIHKTFVLKYQFSPARVAGAGGWTKIAEILPVIENKEDAEKWLHIAEHTTKQHIREAVTEHRKGKPQSECAHKQAYTLRICPACGFKEKI